MPHYVYILASRPGGALYVGRTGDLRTRLAAHRAKASDHTARYAIDRLVWFEAHGEFDPSLRRERAIKRWRRAWKDKLVASANPGWEDIAHLIPDD